MRALAGLPGAAAAARPGCHRVSLTREEAPRALAEGLPSGALAGCNLALCSSGAGLLERGEPDVRHRGRHVTVAHEHV